MSAVPATARNGGSRLPRSLRDRLVVASSWPWLRALEARAHRDDGEALAELGESLDDIGDGGKLRSDPALAFAYFDASARAGYALAFVRLGFAYLDGSLEQTRDARRAVAMFWRGAALGEPVALGQLGTCPAQRSAMAWLARAAAAGHAASQRQLARVRDR